MNPVLVLSALALTTATNVTLVVESPERALNGKGISNIHFGAGINGALISDSQISYQLNGTDKTVYESIEISDGPIPLTFGNLGSDLVASVSLDQPAYVEGSYMTINGSSSVFYACDKLAWDPYQYVSASNLGVGVYGTDEAVPDGCEPIKIRVTGQGYTNSSSSSIFSSAQPSSVAAAVSTASNSALNVSGASNGTITSSDLATLGSNTTVTALSTKYTTIPCPSPTTVTYNSQTYTVTGATTLTVVDCECTGAVSPSSKNSTHPASNTTVVLPTISQTSVPAGLTNSATLLNVGMAAVAMAACAYIL